MKSKLAGYTCANISELQSISATNSTAVLVHDIRTWFIKDATVTTSGLNRVNTSVGYFRAIPDMVYSDNYLVADVIANTSNTELDMSTLPRYINLTLNTNTVLTILNMVKNARYILKINFNGYVISNLFTLFKFTNNYDWKILNTSYDHILLEIQYLNILYAEPLFYTADTNPIKSYISNSTDIVFKTLLYSDFVDTGTYTYDVVATGSSSHVEDALSLNNGSLLYDTDSNIYLNEKDFDIQFYIKFLNSSNYGTILAKWSDIEKQFWIRVSSTKVLSVSFNEGASIVTLETNLTTHISLTNTFIHISVTRVGNVYRLFVNGQLVTSTKSTNFMSNHTGDLVIGKLQNSPIAGDIGNTSFSGLIKDISITTNIKNNYNFYYTHSPTHTTNVISFIFQGSLVEAVAGVSPISSSTVVTNPLLVASDRLSTSLIGNYKKKSLDYLHHLEYSWFNDLTGDVTIEGWVKNLTGNTRGTIIYNGTPSSHNFHVGIYDNTLTCSIKDAALVLTSSTTVTANTWTHFAFVREGTNNRLYQDGKLVDQETSSVGLDDYAAGLLCIKRFPTQSLTEAELNTSLYPSKSHMYVDGIRIMNKALYTGTDTVNANFSLPLEYSNR